MSGDLHLCAISVATLHKWGRIRLGFGRGEPFCRGALLDGQTSSRTARERFVAFTGLGGKYFDDREVVVMICFVGLGRTDQNMGTRTTFPRSKGERTSTVAYCESLIYPGVRCVWVTRGDSFHLFSPESFCYFHDVRSNVMTQPLRSILTQPPTKHPLSRREIGGIPITDTARWGRVRAPRSPLADSSP